MSSIEICLNKFLYRLTQIRVGMLLYFYFTDARSGVRGSVFDYKTGALGCLRVMSFSQANPEEELVFQYITSNSFEQLY